MLLRARALTAIDFSPREVWFEHSAPADTREHRRIFRAPLRFEQTCHALVLDRGLLDHPLVTADSRLCALLDRQAQDLLARLPRESSVSDRTRRLLREVLRGGDAGVAAIARRLGMSPRSLQRRLAAEGSSYRGLLDEVRREIAVRHLGERDLAISEVASALGFSDATGFYRAFRRWTGASPAGYRARGAGPGVAVARSA
jgi:AraC-like DNA-binding protein